MAYAGACVPKVATPRIRITPFPESTASLYEHNASDEGTGHLASVAYRRFLP